MSKRALLALIASIAVAVVPATTPAAAQRPAPPGGSLVLIGGGLADHNTAIYGAIVQLAGGPGKARIGVITAASSTPAEDPDAGTPDCNNSVCNGEYYSALLRKYGAHAEWIPIDLDHVGAAEDPAVVTQINGLTGFFFGGGDQYRYVTTMMRSGGRDSAALAAIRHRLRTGAVVAGTSAGAQIQAGRDMITGGSSYRALVDGSTPGYFDDANRLGYLHQGGFGFFDAGLIDTHFSARGRVGRSVRLAADTGNERIFGLDEDTALQVTGVGTQHEKMRILGSAGVHVLDLRDAEAGQRHGVWSVRDVSWSRLSAGDEYDATRWTVRTGKPAYRGTPGPCSVAPATDVFARDVVAVLGIALTEQRGCRSVSGHTAEDTPRFTVELHRGREFRAYRSPAATSYTDVRLAIRAS